MFAITAYEMNTIIVPCTAVIDCLSNPCLNGGSCFARHMLGGFECNCRPEFTGSFCQSEHTDYTDLYCM